MTRAEFDTWLELHYREAYAVARRRTNSDADAEEALHNAILAFLTNRDLAAIGKPWTYLVNAIRYKAKDLRVGQARTRAAKRAFRSEAGAAPSPGRRRPAPRAD